MAGLDISERRLPQDGGIHVMMDKRPVDLRVSTMPGKHGEKVVIRIIDNDKASVNLEKLGFGYETLKQWRKLIALPNGIVLVTGPTGSGKSTTLYAALQELNRDDVNICTVEDPVEYSSGGRQPVSGEREGRLHLRQRAAVAAAAGPGHHDGRRNPRRRDRASSPRRRPSPATWCSPRCTPTTPPARSRGCITSASSRTWSAPRVGGVLAQRLVRKLCQRCKEPYEPTPNEKRQIEKFAGSVERLFRPKGCPRCRNLGYTGRIGIYELFVPDDRLIERISQGATLNEMRELAKQPGMKTLRMDGMEKVKSGITTLEEVYRVTA